jgi:hypothetical protein
MGNCKSNNKTNVSQNNDTDTSRPECIQEKEASTQAPVHNKKESMKSRWKRFAEMTKKDMMDNM